MIMCQGTGVPWVEKILSIEITPTRKENFYTLMQKKMLDLIKQGEIYLNTSKKTTDALASWMNCFKY